MIAASRPRPARTIGITEGLYALAAVLSAALIVASWQDWVSLPLNPTEVLAFVTGAWTVWLAARNNVWNWPIGVLNSAFFVVLFWEARLFFDTGLNVFYVLSGLWGWWVWAFSGQRHQGKPITRVSLREAGLLAVVLVVFTLAMWRGGVHIEDSAPFLDALTTGLSVGAQWLMMRRFIEHWALWIAADVIYVPLYLSKGLPLTGFLYVIFFLMCLRGVVEWRATLRRQGQEASALA
jgi:nicotinamide mononucleotide transporter